MALDQSVIDAVTARPGESDMSLPPGATCQTCAHYRGCVGLFGCKPTNVKCDWSPSRYKACPQSDASAK